MNKQERPYNLHSYVLAGIHVTKAKVLSFSQKKCAYLHLLDNPEKAIKNQADMNDYHLTILHQDLNHNTLKEYLITYYNKYFDVTETPRRYKKSHRKRMQCAKQQENTVNLHCFLNEGNDPFEAISFTEARILLKKPLESKEHLNFRRT